jgi:glycolate oxidase
MTVATAIPDGVVDELIAILGTEGVLTSKPARYNRTRVPAPFPVHRWAEYVPDLAVLPRTAEQVSEVVKLANRHRIPITPGPAAPG